MSNYLENFEMLDFKQKINALYELDKIKDIDAIPRLYGLYSRSDLDVSIESLIVDILKSLMSSSEKFAVEGLSYDSIKVKKLCIRVCGENKYSSSIIPLQNIILGEDGNGLLADILFALSQFDDPEILNIFKKYIYHEDYVISALAISMLGGGQDSSSIELLCRIINEREFLGDSLRWDFNVSAAVEALASIPDEKGISFLASKINYHNLTGRYFIHRELVKIGRRCISHIISAFDTDDTDTIVAACNIIGKIGHKEGVTELIRLYDKEETLDPQIKIALYEALGAIPTMKSVILLFDGLDETDPHILETVISALDGQISAGIVGRLTEMLKGDSDRSKKLLPAIIKSKARHIIRELYNDSDVSSKFLACLQESDDMEMVSSFISILKDIGTPQALVDAETLTAKNNPVKKIRILAVDDSKTLLHYYSRILDERIYHLVTAENGKIALDILERSYPFDIILTDINMPEMDGIDMIKCIRKMARLRYVPIVVITTENKEELEIEDIKNLFSVYFKKPVNPKILRDTINQLFQKNEDI